MELDIGICVVVGCIFFLKILIRPVVRVYVFYIIYKEFASIIIILHSLVPVGQHGARAQLCDRDTWGTPPKSQLLQVRGTQGRNQEGVHTPTS